MVFMLCASRNQQLFPIFSAHQADNITLPVRPGVHLDQKLKRIDSELQKLRVQQLALSILNTALTTLWFGLSVLSFFSFNVPQFLWSRKYQILKGVAPPLVALGYLYFTEADRRARVAKLQDRKDTILLLYNDSNLSPYQTKRKIFGLPWIPSAPEPLMISQSAYTAAKQDQIERLGKKALEQLKELLTNPKPGDDEEAMIRLDDYQERSRAAKEYLFSGALPYILDFAHAKGVETRIVDSKMKIVQIVPAQWGWAVTEDLENGELCRLSWVNYQESGYFAGTKEKPLILMKMQNDRRSMSLKTFFKIISDNQELENLPAEFIRKFWETLAPSAS